MSWHIFMDAGAQSTCASAINGTQTTVTLQSAAGFTVPASPQQFSVIILDTGNPAWNPASPLATPYEYQPVNSVSGNVLTFGTGGGGASRAAYAGTTPHAYFAGATVAAVMLAEDMNASFGVKFDDQSPTGASVRIPASGSFPSSGYSTIRVSWCARDTSGNNADELRMQFIGDTGSNYNFAESTCSTTGVTSTTGTNAGSYIRCGVIPGGGSAAALIARGWIEIFNFTDTTFRKTATAHSFRDDASLTGVVTGGGDYIPFSSVISFITLFPGSGNFGSGSRFVTELRP